MAARLDFDGFLGVSVDNRKLRTDNNFDGQMVSASFGSGGGWYNPMTGLGTFERDKVMQGRFGTPARIPDPELQAMFNGNALCRRIVTTTPREMLRLGYGVTLPDPNGDQHANAALAAEIEGALTYHQVNAKLLEALIFSGVFGGGLIFIGADDGQSPDLPLDEQNIKTIRYMSFLDRRWLTALTYYSDPFAPKYGEVETYQVTNIFGPETLATVVHESRCIRIEGASVDLLMRRQLAGWTFSYLQAPYDTLRQFESSAQGIANLMTDMAQATMSVNGLMQLITNDEQALMQRMRWTDMTRSAGRMVLLDAENEKFERKATPLNGVPETLVTQMLLVSMATEIPQTFLFGRSPQGMNATGDSDFRMYYDRADFRRANELAPMLLRIIRLICLAKDGPTGGRDPMVEPLTATSAPKGRDLGGNARSDDAQASESGSAPDATPDPLAPTRRKVPSIRTVKDEKTGTLKKSIQGGVEIEWPKLWVPTELERADIYLKMAQADDFYVGNGTLLPAEVAMARFRNGTLNVETTIDVTAQKEQLDVQRKNVAKGLPPVAPPGAGKGPNTDKPDEGSGPPAKKAA